MVCKTYDNSVDGRTEGYVVSKMTNIHEYEHCITMTSY